MLQRLQSLLLGLIVLLMVLFLFSTIWEKQNLQTGQKAHLNAIVIVYKKNIPENTPVETTHSFPLAIFALAAAVTAGYSISQYRNRVLQLKAGLVNSLILAGLLGLIVYYSLDAEKLFDPQEKGVYGMGFYLPTAALLLNMVANRLIKRDEDIVRAADRMR